MEQVLNRVKTFAEVLPMWLIMFTGIATMVVIAYGLDWIAPGVHDAFHDFRHVIGMACH